MSNLVSRPVKGITLLELVVLLGILTVLSGLLLPALQHSHERADRTACINNVARICRAVYQYAEAHQGALPNLDTHLPGETYRTCFFDLLPWVGQEELYRTVQQAGPNTFSCQVPDQDTAPYSFLDVYGNVPVYNCPAASNYKQTADCRPLSPPSSEAPATVTPPPGGQQNYTNYAVNYLLLGKNNSGLEKAPFGHAICAPVYKLNTIPDGTASTVLLGEKNSQFNLWDRPATSAAIYAPMFGCVLNATAPPPYRQWGRFTFNALEPPLYVRQPGNGSFQRASSVHRGGMVTGMANGEVRIVGYEVSPQVWLEALTPDDRLEILSSGW
jgi:type II secretory pathway pseudopilin PulG